MFGRYENVNEDTISYKINKNYLLSCVNYNMTMNDLEKILDKCGIHGLVVKGIYDEYKKKEDE